MVALFKNNLFCPKWQMVISANKQSPKKLWLMNRIVVVVVAGAEMERKKTPYFRCQLTINISWAYFWFSFQRHSKNRITLPAWAMQLKWWYCHEQKQEQKNNYVDSWTLDTKTRISNRFDMRYMFFFWSNALSVLFAIEVQLNRFL